MYHPIWPSAAITKVSKHTMAIFQELGEFGTVLCLNVPCMKLQVFLFI